MNPDDIGKVIGRSGRTATALRTVVGALAGRDQVRVDFVDVDRPRTGGPRRTLSVGPWKPSRSSSAIVGRPHGVRGEVASVFAPTNPNGGSPSVAQLRCEGESTGPDGRVQPSPQRSMAASASSSSRSHRGRDPARCHAGGRRRRRASGRASRGVLRPPADRAPGAGSRRSGGRARSAPCCICPAQDVLEIRTEAGDRLVPFVAALVPEVDLAAGTLRLADVPGLLRYGSAEDEP